MTVNKAGTSSTSTTTKKKKTSSSSTTASTSTSKTSKVVESKASKHEIVHSEGLSKSSSSSSLQISDVSHLPLQAHLTSYLVTETLPTGSGEKITTYHPETGATSTEYRHFVAQDTSSQHSTDIQQIGSVLNQSIQNLNESTSNLSQVSGSTYTVTEPMEELRLSYNPNDSAWNGKFVQEQSVQKGKKTSIVKQSSTATSHEESSSSAKTTSSSYVVEVADGKERIIDQKRHEASSATHSCNDERLDMKSGTDITPEVHYTQKSTKSSTKMDSAKPELQQPKTKSSQAVREIHQVGDHITSSTNVIQDKAVSSTHAIRDKTINFIDNEITDSINKQKSGATSTEQVSKNLGTTSTGTKTVTYYDSKGNVVKTVTEVDSSATPDSEITSSDTTTFLDKKASNIRTSHTKTDSSKFHGHVVDSSSTIDDRAERVVKDNTISSTDIHSNDRLHEKTHSKSSPVTSTPKKQSSPDRKRPSTDIDGTKTYYVDENYVDTNKIRQAQISSDSTDFYGHNVDSSRTVVDKVYDTSAVQNTIGYRERVVMDQNMDTTDLVFSNDRNYGKTGWNGQFTYETPESSKKSPSPEDKSPTAKPTKSPNENPAPGTRRSQSPSKKPTKKSPDELPAAGAPSRKSPEKQKSKSTVQTQDFLTTETQENIKQFTEKDTEEWKKTVDEGSSTVTEGDTTIEYFKIVDGKKIPIGQKVIPGQTTTESYDNITGRRESKTTIHDSKTVEDLTERKMLVDETKPRETTPKRVAPEDLPAAGMPTRKPGDRKPTDQKSAIKDQKDVRRDSTTTEYTEIEGDTTIEYFTIVDGKRVPAGTKVIPGKTVKGIYDSTTSRRDSSTTIEQNTQKIVDQRSTTDHYTTIEGSVSKVRKPSPEKIPPAGMPSRKPTQKEYTEIQGDTTTEYFEIVDGKSIPTGTKVIPGNMSRETHNITETTSQESVIDRTTEKNKRPEDRQPKRSSPEELPAAGMPSRKPTEKKPTDGTTKPKGTEDYDGYHKTLDEGSSTIIEGDTTIEYFKIVDGKKIPIGQKVIPGSTTTEYYDNISGRRESKTTTHDTKMLIDNTNIFEEVVSSDRRSYPEKTPTSKKPSKTSPEDLPAAGMPSRKPKDDGKVTKTDQKDIRRGSTTEYTEIKGDTVIEYFDIVDGKRIPKGTKIIPGGGTTTTGKLHESTERRDSVTEKYVKDTKNIVDDSKTVVESTNIFEEYTIVDGKRVPISRTPGKIFPEGLPAAGMPSKKDSKSPKRQQSPQKKKPTTGYPETTDDSMTMESSETVSKVFDSKTTVIKDSQTYIDRENTTEHYTVINGERVPITPGDRRPTDEYKRPEELPTAGMPSKKPEKQPEDGYPKKKPESPSRKSEVQPEDLPAAGRPTKPDKSTSTRKPTDANPDVVEDSTTIKSFETVSKQFDTKTSVIKDSQTFVDRESTSEYYTILNGQRVPVGPRDKVPIEDLMRPDELPAAGMPSRKGEKQPVGQSPKEKPRSPTRKSKVQPEDLPAAGRPTKPADKSTPTRKPTDAYPDDGVDSTTVDSIETVSKVFDSKTTVIKDSQTFVDRESTAENYTIINGERVPVGPGDRKPIEELPAAGMPSRKPGKQPETTPEKKPESPAQNQKLRPEELPAAGRPTKPDDKRVSPRKPGEGYPNDTVYSTTVESFETVSKVFDSKTKLIKDTQTFVDKESTSEKYTIINGERVPLGPRDRKPTDDSKRPEELPAAGMPSRKPENYPDDKTPKRTPESPSRKDKLQPEDLPAAGRPTTSDVVPRKKPTDEYPDSTTVESFETVSKVFDSKTTVIKDSQTFVDRESTSENYTIINGERVPVGPADRKPIEDSKRPEELPAAGMPSRKPQKHPDDKTHKKKPESPSKKKLAPEDLPAAGTPSKPRDKAPIQTDSTTQIESFESVSNVFDSKTTVVKDSKTFVDNQSTVEYYTIVNGERVPIGPGDKRPIDDYIRPEELPAAGMPSRKGQKVPEDKTPKKKPKSPTRKDKVHPEDLPAAGRPSKPSDKLVPVQKPDTSTIETFETVSKIFDSKTTVIKDNQTFVDQQSNAEHYTIINGERVPTDKKPIREKPSRKSPDELPAAGRPSRKSPERKPKKGPRGPDVTTVEDYEITNNVVDVRRKFSEDFTTKTVVENFTTDIRDVKDTIIKDTVDRVDRTFIKEDIIDIKDINEVENITNIQRVSENKVIKLEKVIKEPAPTKHYKPPMKEQCICELCTCGESSTCSHK